MKIHDIFLFFLRISYYLTINRCEISSHPQSHEISLRFQSFLVLSFVECSESNVSNAWLHSE